MDPCQCSPHFDDATASLTARLRHLYVCAEKSTRQIGEIVGISRSRVTRILREAGVVIGVRGAGRVRSRRRAPDPPGLAATLEDLYVRQRLTSGQIGRILGMPERRVRDRLREFGIPIRTRGRCNREDRIVVDPDRVAAMYVAGEMSADQVAEALGVSRKVVLRNAHEHGLPVRVPPDMAGQDTRQMELLQALYADPLVHETLERHGIPHVPTGGPIWDRFPSPVPLGKELLHDLYVGCGLGSQHIELLTGAPSATVRRALASCDIALRPPGGRSPFLRRWLRSGAPKAT